MSETWLPASQSNALGTGSRPVAITCSHYRVETGRSIIAGHLQLDFCRDCAAALWVALTETRWPED